MRCALPELTSQARPKIIRTRHTKQFAEHQLFVLPTVKNMKLGHYSPAANPKPTTMETELQHIVAHTFNEISCSDQLSLRLVASLLSLFFFLWAGLNLVRTVG